MLKNHNILQQYQEIYYIPTLARNELRKELQRHFAHSLETFPTHF